MAFAAVTYANLIKQAQEDVWRTLEEDATVQTYTTNILNNQPASKVGERIGVPYVIVPTPTISEERLTLTQKRIFLTFDIEVVFTRIENMALIDRLRQLLSSSSGTFSSTYVLHQFLNSGQTDYITLPDGHKAQRYILSVQYEWIGDPS